MESESYKAPRKKFSYLLVDNWDYGYSLDFVQKKKGEKEWKLLNFPVS